MVYFCLFDPIDQAGVAGLAVGQDLIHGATDVKDDEEDGVFLLDGLSGSLVDNSGVIIGKFDLVTIEDILMLAKRTDPYNFVLLFLIFL